MTPRSLCSLLLCAVLAVAPNLALAQTDPTAAGCNPAAQTRITNMSQTGAQDALTRVRNAYSQPTSVFQLGCLNSLLSGGGIPSLFNTSAIMQQLISAAQNQVCSAVNQLRQATTPCSFNANMFFGSPGMPSLGSLCQAMQSAVGSTGISGSSSGIGGSLSTGSGTPIVQQAPASSQQSTPAATPSNSTPLGTLFNN